MNQQNNPPVNIDPQQMMDMVRTLTKNRQSTVQADPQAFQALLNAQMQQGK